MYGVTWSLEHIGEAAYVDQDAGLGRFAASVADAVPRIREVVPVAAIPAADDATTLIDHVGRHGGRGIYMVVGSDLASGHHTPAFDFDESALADGVEVIHRVVLGLVNGADA
jgi:aminobenzoyl-glutamate utilization protein A